ncbi:MAG: chorismate synthase [Candidatus Dormibacteria bacterium]
MHTLRFLTAGESHGPELVTVLDGVPAGLPVAQEDIDRDLRRRQQGYGRSRRQVIEQDTAQVVGGIAAGRTTGGPIALRVENRDWKNWKDRTRPVMTIPRPGHADLAGALKYRHDDLRVVLERASARETAARVAAGAIARRLLSEFGITVASQVVAIGGVGVQPADLADPAVRERVEASSVRVADPHAEAQLVERIDAARLARDTVGGICSVEVFGLPAGLGSYVQWDRRLDGRLAQAVMSIQAIKAVEVGDGFRGAGMLGSELHDEILPAADVIPGLHGLGRASNRAGGLEGGVSNGQPVVVRMAMKPISTLLHGIGSVDVSSGEATRAKYERSDICAVPAAAVVGEAMVALVVADALLEKFGGDSIAELRERLPGPDGVG